MTHSNGDENLKKLLQDSDDLLEQLEEINGSDQASTKASPAHQSRQEGDSRQRERLDLTQYGDQNSQPILPILILAGFFLIAVAIGSQKPSTTSGAGQGRSPAAGNSGQAQTQELPNTKPDFQPDNSNQPRAQQSEVYFNGITLPVTNRLCNKKVNFCIYGLADLVQNESGKASYTFEDISNGQRVEIYGDIAISNLDKSGDGSRTFTFSFRDDQSRTTPGWAGAGYFNLEQDPKKPGILTRFKTTESYGPKTPVGLENTSYLFPN